MPATFSKLRGAMLSSRIDAMYYRPEFIANEARLRNSGLQVVPLKSLVKSGRRAVYFDTSTREDSDAPTDWVPFLTADDFGVDGFFLNLNARRRVSPGFAARYPNGRLRSNELLVKVKGPNQITAYNEREPDRTVLVSGTIWGALPRRDLVDPHYLVTALSSKYAATARSRLRTNLNVEFLSPTDLEMLDLPLPRSRDAQGYIGDKVRQAERLRDCASRCHSYNLRCFESRYLGHQSVARCSRMDAALLGDRLDHMHYRSDLLDGYRLVTRSEHVVLGDKAHFQGLTDGDHGNPEYGDGPLYLRASEMDGFVVQPRRCTRLSESYARRVPASCFGTSGDVVFSIVGTLGLVAALQDSEPIALSRGIAKVRPTQLRSHYVKAYMRSQPFRNELLRNSVGSVQRGVYLESLESIPIPVLDDCAISAIASSEETADCMLLLSESLVLAAKLLVEDLIDGRISEGELIDAQQSLDRGDKVLDRAILSRLTEDGIDVAGKPLLFSDLARLCEAIEESHRTISDNGDNA